MVKKYPNEKGLLARLSQIYIKIGRKDDAAQVGGQFLLLFLPVAVIGFKIVDLLGEPLLQPLQVAGLFPEIGLLVFVPQGQLPTPVYGFLASHD